MSMSSIISKELKLDISLLAIHFLQHNFSVWLQYKQTLKGHLKSCFGQRRHKEGFRKRTLGRSWKWKSSVCPEFRVQAVGCCLAGLLCLCSRESSILKHGEDLCVVSYTLRRFAAGRYNKGHFVKHMHSTFSSIICCLSCFFTILSEQSHTLLFLSWNSCC